MDTEDLFILAPPKGVQVDNLPRHTTYYNFEHEKETNKLTTMHLNQEPKMQPSLKALYKHFS